MVYGSQSESYVRNTVTVSELKLQTRNACDRTKKQELQREMRQYYNNLNEITLRCITQTTCRNKAK